MKKKMKNPVADECGEVMLEASIILVPVLILLMVLISLTFMFYQQALMNTIATEIAADVAKNVKFTNMEIGANSITNDNYENAQMFRTSFGQAALQKAKEEVGKKYGVKRMTMSSFGINAGELVVDCDLKLSGVGRMYAVVTVSQPTEFFLSDLLQYVGITDEKTGFSAVAYAECTDLMGYASMVNFAVYVTDIFDLLSPVGKLYGSVENFYKNLKDVAKTLMN